MSERNEISRLETTPDVDKYASGGDDPYYGVWPPQPLQKRVRKGGLVAQRDAVLRAADEAVRRAQVVMGKRVSAEGVGSSGVEGDVFSSVEDEVAYSFEEGVLSDVEEGLDSGVEEESPISIEEELCSSVEGELPSCVEEELTLQEELELQLRREEDERSAALKHQETSQPTPKSIKKSFTVRFANIEQPESRSNTKPTQPPTPSTLSPLTWEQKHATKPNLHARLLLESNNHSIPRFLHSINLPASACHDTEIRDGLRILVNQISDLAETHFGFRAEAAQLRAVLGSLPKQTVRIIGCVASGGPGGAKGWEALFLDKEKRQALVCAVVGNVIVEQVLKHLFFGGTKEQIGEVEGLQFTHRHEDGMFFPLLLPVGLCGR